MVRATRNVCVAVVVCAMLARCAGGAAPAIDAAVRDAAAAKTCQVVVEGVIGLPLAAASGFLMGEGKFVVTDLGTVAQAGVKGVTLRFPDGSTAAGRMFGMADPALGVVVIQVEDAASSRGGLALQTEVPAGGPLDAVVVGWKGGQDVEFTVGRVRNGLAPADLAAMLKIQAPKTDAVFATFEGPRPAVASGAVVIDGSGAATGMLLQVQGTDKPVVVPAPAIRRALLEAVAQLKPLSELPKPTWPVAVQPAVSRSVTPAEFAQVIRAIKNRSRCDRCDGKGKITVERIVGQQKIGGLVRPVVRQESETCPVCKGESIICPDGLYSHFARMAEAGVWLISSPHVDPKAKEAAAQSRDSLLQALTRVGPLYRQALVRQAQADLARPDGTYPRGVVVYAQVRELVSGPDGQYTLLSPHNSGATLSVKTEGLAQSWIETKPPASRLDVGDWIILAGVAEGVASLDNRKPIHVRPFGWVAGPRLGRGPRPVEPEPPVPGDVSPPPSKRTDGVPDFFGL